MKKKPMVPTARSAGTMIAVLGVPLLIIGIVILNQGDWGLGLILIFVGLGGAIMGMVIRRGAGQT